MWLQNLTLIFSLVIFFHLPSVKSDSPFAPALYVLGDSTVDSGNNNFLPTQARANYLPYGIDFDGGPTGRFTNGRTVTDFVAEFIGLPHPPPYLSFKRSVTVVTGVNYASGSCGILPETGNYIGQCLNLHNQTDLFRRTVELDLPKQFNSSNGLSEYLSKSRFFISIGSGDYINNYLQPNIYNTSKLYSPKSFAEHLTDALSHQLEKLYKLGARRITVFEIGPLGCLPSFTRHTKHNGTCVEEINQLVSLFNIQLKTTLKKLTATLPGSVFLVGQINQLSYDVVTDPSGYGLTESSNPCCITRAAEASECVAGLTPCPETNKHYFWDDYHFTEIVNSVIVLRLALE